jgi:Tol biopolymer transport system component
MTRDAARRCAAGPWAARKRRARAALGLILFAAACAAGEQPGPGGSEAAGERETAARGAPVEKTPLERDDEPHLRNLRQLTFGGENAEAYWNLAGTELILQSTRGRLACDQIFRMDADGSKLRMVSTGEGRTTCGYIQIDGSIIYASTHGHRPDCLPDPDRSQGYVWPLYPEMDIWRAGPGGENPQVLFQSPGYDAEATVCPRDGRILFTSSKDGDLELYVMDRDGGSPKRLTHEPGYDGGAFFSPDCSRIVWRASRPKGADLEEYRALLEKHLVRPSRLEIFTADADGRNPVQVTSNGAANFAPYMHPDNRRILFASNRHDPRGRNFDLFLINRDGSGEEQVTRNPTFDGFPMWSHDGKKLVFASNRNNRTRGETNVFVADWID